MKLNYFYKCEADQFTFYRLPKILVVNEMFSHISYGAKILYGLLLDRIGLSLSNHWHDEFGRAYIIYSIVEIMEDMNCSKATAIKMMSELDKLREKTFLTQKGIIRNILLGYDIPTKTPDSYTHFMRHINSLSYYTFKLKVHADKNDSNQLDNIEQLDHNIEEIMKLALSFI